MTSRPSRRARAADRRRTAEGRQERRDELVQAAVAALRRHGAGASMEQLAAEAGVTKPILYRYFGDRDGLVRAVAERFAGELLTELRTALQAGGEPRELLAATIDAYLAFVERDPEIYRFLVRQPGVPATGAELSGFIREVGSEVTTVLGEQLREAGADSGGAEAWGYGIVGMVHLAGDWWLERHTMPRARLVSYLVDLLWSGLSGVGAPGAEPRAQHHAGPRAPGDGRNHARPVNGRAREDTR